MSDPLGLFAQDDPLELFDKKKAPVGAKAQKELEDYEQYKSSILERNQRTSIPGAEAYDRTPPKSFDAWKKQRDEDIKNKQIGLGEAAVSFATGIPATFVAGLAGITAPINPMTKRKPMELFEDVQSLLTYAPRTSEGQDIARAIGDPLQAFPPVGAYINSPGMRRAAKPKTFEERLNEATQEQPPVQQPEIDSGKQAFDSIVGSQLEGWNEPITRSPAHQPQRSAMGDIVATMEQQRMADADNVLAQRQAALEAEVAAQRARDEMARTSAMEQNPTGYAEWVEAQRQAANTRLPGNNDPLNLGPSKLTKASQYPDVNDFPNLLQDEPYRYEGGIDYNTVDTKALPIEVADMLRTGDRIADPFDRVSYRQNANRMAQPLEDHIANLNRSEALPEDIARMEGEGGVNQGMSRGQRGAIDLNGVLESLYKLRAGLHTPKDYVQSFLGAFDSELKHDMSWKYALEESLDPKSRTRLVLMSPDTFHKLAMPREGGFQITSNSRRDSIREGLASPDGLTSMPMLRVDSGKVYGHEGRHRMDVFKEMGVGQVPVILRDASVRNEQGKLPYKFLISEGGGPSSVRHHVPMSELIDVFNDAPSLNRGMSKTQRGAIDLQALGFRTGSEADKLVKDLMGSKLRAAIPKGEDVIANAMEAGKDSRQSILFSAGATLQAMKTRSPLIQGAARIIQGHKNIAEDVIRQFVFPVEEKFRKVHGKDIEDLATLLKKEQFGRQALTPEQLASLGLSEQQLLAYQALDNMHKEAFKAQNDVRVAAGKPPITQLEYYMSSRWQGDFRIPLYDEKGKLVWYVAADNKWAANKHAKSVMEKFPGLTKGGMSVIKSSRKGADIGDLYTQMLDVAGRDNPMVKAIKQWIESDEAAKAEFTRGQVKHFEPKSNVRGFIGDRPYKSARSEAVDYIQSQIDYAKNAFHWAELQKAGVEIKKILADENINATQPRNVQYIREYWLDQLGMNEAKFVKALEDTVRSAGISPNQLGRGINNVKNFWTVHKLAANLGFLASNVMQFSMTLPQLFDIQHKYGGNAVSSLISGTIGGMLMAAGHTTRKNPQFYKAMAMAGSERFVLDAMKYAEDNSVIARSIYDEAPLKSSFSPYTKTMNFAGKTITLPETYLRGSVYMSYVHMLKSSGKFADDLSIFREAEERTNASMGDYREGERALIFSKMGQLGNAANTLQTFPMNYYNQWSWATREASKGNVLPFVAMFAVQGYLAGAFGLPMFQEVDKGWEQMKDWLAELDPTLWEKVKDFSLKEFVLHTGGADILYGSLSEDTGLAMTSRAAAPVPTEMVQTPFAPAADVAGMAVDAGKLAFDPMDKQKQAQAALSFAPAGATGYLETGPLKDQTSVTRPDGSVVYKKTSKLADRDAVVVRDENDEFVRKFGLRTQKEQVQKDLQYYAGKRASQTKNVLRDLPDRIYNAARKGEKEDVKEFIELYARLGGDPRSLTTGMGRATQQEFLTPAERLITGKTPAVEAVKQYKLMMDTLKELGYAE